jgi:hypothetical protein
MIIIRHDVGLTRYRALLYVLSCKHTTKRSNATKIEVTRAEIECPGNVNRQCAADGPEQRTDAQQADARAAGSSADGQAPLAAAARAGGGALIQKCADKCSSTMP